MFLWTLPWATKVLLALITSPTPWPSFQEWSMEWCLDVFVLIPMSVLLGQAYIRIAASLSVPKPLRRSLPPAIWTTLCQVVFADVIVFVLLSSVAHRVDLSHAITTGGWNENWGWNAPFMIFTVRLIVVCMSLTVGESFFPLALTGGIACGKSTISQLLQERNFHMIDADKIGHQILLPPWHEDLSKPEALVTPKDSVYVDILKAFGGDNPNQGSGEAVPGVNEDHPLLDEHKCIDRAKLGARVFGNNEARKTLNGITHKRIFVCLLKNMASSIYLGNAPWVCAEIPLLFESGPFRYVFGLALVVACTPSQQLERLCHRNPELSKEECQKRIDSQMPMTVKVQKADIVLWNDKDYYDDKTKDSKEDQARAKAQRDEALAKQADKAVQMIQQRVKGLMNANLTQVLLMLSGSMVMSACFKLFMGTASEAASS